MTTPNGDAALREPPKSDFKNDSSANMLQQVIQEQKLTSDSGKWKPTAQPEPAQLVLTDPYTGVGTAKDFLKKGVIGDCKVQSGAVGSKPGDCNFKPDSEYKTEGAKQWRQQALKQSSKGLDVDKDGNYNVQKGDSVWGIAERRARQTSGRKPTPEETTKEMNKLLEANKGKYPGLDCNPNMLRPGMKLEVPGTREEQARRAQRDGSAPPAGIESNKPDNRRSEAATEGTKSGGKTETQADKVNPKQEDAGVTASRGAEPANEGASLTDRPAEKGATLTDKPGGSDSEPSGKLDSVMMPEAKSNSDEKSSGDKLSGGSDSEPSGKLDSVMMPEAKSSSDEKSSGDKLNGDSEALADRLKESIEFYENYRMTFTDKPDAELPPAYKPEEWPNLTEKHDEGMKPTDELNGVMSFTDKPDAELPPGYKPEEWPKLTDKHDDVDMHLSNEVDSLVDFWNKDEFVIHPEKKTESNLAKPQDAMLSRNFFEEDMNYLGNPDDSGMNHVENHDEGIVQRNKPIEYSEMNLVEDNDAGIIQQEWSIENSELGLAKDNDAGILQKDIKLDEHHESLLNLEKLQDEVLFLRGGSMGRDIRTADRAQPMLAKIKENGMSLPPLSYS